MCLSDTALERVNSGQRHITHLMITEASTISSPWNSTMESLNALDSSGVNTCAYVCAGVNAFVCTHVIDVSNTLDYFTLLVVMATISFVIFSQTYSASSV